MTSPVDAPACDRVLLLVLERVSPPPPPPPPPSAADVELLAVLRLEVFSSVGLDLRDPVLVLERDLSVSVTPDVVVSDTVVSATGLAVRRRLRVVLSLSSADLDRVRVRPLEVSGPVVNASFDTGVVLVVLDVAGGVLYTVVTSLGRVAAAYPAAVDVDRTTSRS